MNNLSVLGLSIAIINMAISIGQMLPIDASYKIRVASLDWICLAALNIAINALLFIRLFKKDLGTIKLWLIYTLFWYIYRLFCDNYEKLLPKYKNFLMFSNCVSLISLTVMTIVYQNLYYKKSDRLSDSNQRDPKVKIVITPPDTPVIGWQIPTAPDLTDIELETYETS